MALEAISVAPQRLILAGSGMSGRGIQFRMLEPEEKREVDLAAAKQAGEKANQVQVYEIAVRDAMTRMLTAVTDQAGVENLTQEGLVWHPLTVAELNNPIIEYYMWGKKLFTTRDLEFIEAIYGRLHNVQKDEFDAIMGKALKVSGG